MKNKLTLLIAVIVVILLLAYMFAFQVRYDQVAVVTTFDRATHPEYTKDGKIDPLHPGSLVLDAGLHYKAPWPIQSVQSFSTKVQILEDQLEEQQTADHFAVIVQIYVTWRIQDPYAFFVALQNEDNAQKQLRSMFREVTSLVGKYKFDEMVNSDRSQLKLGQFEEEALTRLKARLASTTPKYGISIEHVGIRRISVPGSTADRIFERMRATRERLAATARATGDAEASAIRSEATSAQRTILSFAERRAQAIRKEGDEAALQYYGVFEKDQAFAIFQREMDALSKFLSNNTTFVLDAHDLGFLNPLVNPPGSVAQAKNDK